nr:RNA polymerase sigma factor [Spirochaeta sp.]
APHRSQYCTDGETAIVLPAYNGRENVKHRDGPADNGTTSDADLLRAAQARDQRAFTELVHRYTPPLFSLAYRVLEHETDAEEAVQDIFLKLFDNLDRIDPERNLFAWIYTVAFNHLRSLRRRRWFRQRDYTLPLAEEIVSDGGDSGPEEQTLTAETRRIIERAVATLPRVQRQVFSLRHLEGLSTRETADLLGLTPNTVKTHLRRGRHKIAQTISADETSAWVGAYREEENG